MRTHVLENERLRVELLPDKGTDVVSFYDKRRELDLAWRAPGTPRRDGTFLDTYPGGWQEVLPNGGVPSVYRGAAFDQHGSVATIPWESLGDSTFTVATPRYPLRVTKKLRLDGGSLHITETLTNDAPVQVEAMWGHHLTFGRPFLRVGCRVRLPEGVTVIPHAEAIDPRGRRRTTDLSAVPAPGDPSDICYVKGASWYEVVDQTGSGMRVEWDAQTMPYLWVWQECGATIDYPWWGMAHVLGLEPFSSYPTNGLPEAVANGSALRIGPGETKTFWLTASLVEEG
ncbi:DUF4432 family protein [Allorhizocola rhizosphaerae]|uniref:DUF4432 family protein n=1 Tax=Allorhizocola rhizosphaerae TaxID=1872709 RepID=UPI001B8B441C|nr:DUF4432 family protein [Allorhizocola rhizosphaerae]